MRLVEDNTSSLSLLDIYKNTCAKKGLDHDNPIARYYEKLGSVQARGAQAGHPVLRDILREVQTTMVPKTLLKDWAASTFASATDFWTFRKVFTLQVLEALEPRFHIVCFYRLPLGKSRLGRGKLTLLPLVICLVFSLIHSLLCYAVLCSTAMLCGALLCYAVLFC